MFVAMAQGPCQHLSVYKGIMGMPSFFCYFGLNIHEIPPSMDNTGLSYHTVKQGSYWINRMFNC